jgi:hypothetical protein
MVEDSVEGRAFRFHEEAYATLLFGRLVRERNTREEFFKNPKEYIEKWTGIKADHQQIESVVGIVREIGSVADRAEAAKTSTKWVFTC